MVTYITVDSTRTGVGKYAKDLYMLLAPESKIVQFIFNDRYLDNFYKKPYRGFKSTVLNYMFSKFAFRSGIDFINNNPDFVKVYMVELLRAKQVEIISYRKFVAGPLNLSAIKSRWK